MADATYFGFSAGSSFTLPRGPRSLAAQLGLPKPATSQVPQTEQSLRDM